MLFALAFIVTFVNGGLTGPSSAMSVVDVPLSDTMFVVAHFHMVMGVAPIMVIFGAIYHWYPKITGRISTRAMGQIHFWVTFIGAYAIFFPMHYLGLIGVPRRYHELGEASFVTTSIAELNAFISVMALSRRRCADPVPLQSGLEPAPRAGGRGQSLRATTLEWQTPETPPPHGNWGDELPVVYRWAYDYSVPGAPEDFIPQNSRRPGRLSHGDRLMSIVAFFLAAIAAIVVWWLAGQRLTSAPLARGRVTSTTAGRNTFATGKIGLGVFLTVVGALFSLAISAYFMRMASSDWGALPLPGLLWLNTGILAARSITLHWTRVEAGRRNDEAARIGLLAALALGPCFPRGSTLRLACAVGRRIFRRRESANSFFYLLTGMHGLHIIGGLFALGRVTRTCLANTARQQNAPVDRALRHLLAFSC